jgi:hypothetical protein
MLVRVNMQTSTLVIEYLSDIASATFSIRDGNLQINDVDIFCSHYYPPALVMMCCSYGLQSLFPACPSKDVMLILFAVIIIPLP